MKNWLSSPLAINYLLSLCKNGPLYQNKYLQVYKDLKVKQGYRTCNQLFISPTYNVEKKYQTSDVHVEKIGFEKSQDVSQCIMKWANQYENFSGVNIEKHILPNTTSLLCNVSVFKDSWQCNQPCPIMKVHNSFSYTEDIKYEARFVELPMEDNDFKLVIIVPNEVSSVTRLFTKLVNEGMSAAVSCVQPLFTFFSVLESPNIEFSLENHFCFKENNCDTYDVVQTGNVQINENGTDIAILTLLSYTSTHKETVISADEQVLEKELPFYFAVMYKDTAVFTGRYVRWIN